MKLLVTLILAVLSVTSMPTYASKKYKNRYRPRTSNNLDYDHSSLDTKQTSWIHPKKDAEFQSYYLNLEYLSEELGFSRFQAILLQAEFLKRLRDPETSRELQVLEKEAKHGFLEQVFSEIKGSNINFDKPFRDIKEHEFVIVLDLDEAIIRQWHNTPESDLDIPTARVSNIPDDNYQIPKYSNQRIYRKSADTVYFRHGLTTFFESMSQIPHFGGFLFFSAKNDDAVQDLFLSLKTEYPQFIELFLAAYSRDYLVYDQETQRAMKDPTVFLEEGTDFFIVDDGVSRISDKSKLIQIPKFDEAMGKKLEEHYSFKEDDASKQSAINLSKLALPYLALNFQQKIGNPLFQTTNLAFGLGNTIRYIDGLRSYIRAFSARTSKLDTRTDEEIKRLIFNPDWDGEIIETIDLKPKYHNNWNRSRYTPGFFGFK